MKTYQLVFLFIFMAITSYSQNTNLSSCYCDTIYKTNIERAINTPQTDLIIKLINRYSYKKLELNVISTEINGMTTKGILFSKFRRKNHLIKNPFYVPHAFLDFEELNNLILFFKNYLKCKTSLNNNIFTYISKDKIKFEMLNTDRISMDKFKIKITKNKTCSIKLNNKNIKYFLKILNDIEKTKL